MTETMSRWTSTT